MKFSESLKKNRDFRTVYLKGRSRADKVLAMYAMENGTKRNRLGISVSKKVGNSVVRHRIARLVRENYRLNEENYTRGTDIIVVGRFRAREADFHTIGKSMRSMAAGLGIYNEKEDQQVF
ncbi:MAG: ribonuclease P protein component [Lachnospiraceae bacterium]|nr:ribonuclease P protein component [Lachnospiraceae bacterium]